jgi:hypothetical protein
VPPVQQVLLVQLELQEQPVQLQQQAYPEFHDLKVEGKPEFAPEPFPCFVP